MSPVRGGGRNQISRPQGVSSGGHTPGASTTRMRFPRAWQPPVQGEGPRGLVAGEASSRLGGSRLLAVLHSPSSVPRRGRDLWCLFAPYRDTRAPPSRPLSASITSREALSPKTVTLAFGTLTYEFGGTRLNPSCDLRRQLSVLTPLTRRT